MRQYIITILLLGISMGAWANDYVFKTRYGQYVCMNIKEDGKAAIEVTSTFDPQTCIWTGPDSEQRFWSNEHFLSCTEGTHIMTPDKEDTNNRKITIQPDGKVTSVQGSTYCYLYNIEKYGDAQHNGFQMLSSYDAADAIVATEITVNNNLSVTATQSASYISAVGGTVTITPSLTGTAYYKLGDDYYTTNMGGPYTSPDDSHISTDQVYSY